MRVVNETALATGWTTVFRPDGREALVVVAKGTFVLVDPEGPRLADEQLPPWEADVFGRDPALSAPLFENDFAPQRPECDVLLTGSAHAPRGRAVTALPVGLRVGALHKTFRVTGSRAWRSGLAGGLTSGEPEAFVTQPISYDVAFGGIDANPQTPERVEYYLANPAGRGFARWNTALEGQPMPVTEDAAEPIRDPRKAYRPKAFGPLGRSWQERVQYVGTYDKRWMEERAPFLPLDFDVRYFQAAPADQRIPHPRGGEVIELTHLVPATLSDDACVRTRVPQLSVAMAFVPMRGAVHWLDGQLDTLCFEPDANRFSCVWRAHCPLTRDAFEMREVVVCIRDAASRGRLRARAAGKPYFRGLASLARARKAGAL